MAEYLAPGVYTEQVESGAMPIEGASTSTAGFLGETERGPVIPQFLTSFEEYRRTFGGFAHYREGMPLAGTNLAYAVQGFFQNGGSRCYVGRVTDEKAVAKRQVPGYVPVGVLGTSVDAVDFGEVVLDLPVTRRVLLRNDGIENDPDVTISSIELTDGDTGEFDIPSANELGLPLVLSPGDSLAVDVTYVPDTTGDVEATLTVDHDAVGSSFTIDLTGTGLDADDAAELVVDPDPVDFGIVAEGSEVTRTVRLSNAGPEGASPLEVTDVNLDGDTNDVFEFAGGSDPDPFDLPPGGAHSFDVIYHDENDERVSEASLIISVDETDENFDLRGETVAPEDALGVSTTVVDFGTVTPRTRHERRITVSNLGDPAEDHGTLITIQPEVDDANQGFDVRTVGSGPTDLAPGESMDLIVGFAPDPDQLGSADLEIHYEDEQGNDEMVIVELDGHGENVENVLVAPAELDFGRVVAGDARTMTFQLSNGGSEGAPDIEIDEFELDDVTPSNSFTVLDDPEDLDAFGSGEFVTVAVEFTPKGTDEASGTLTVTSGDGDDVEIDLVGEGTDAASTFEAVGPGEWGGRVAVQVRNSSRDNETFRVTIRYWSRLASAGPSSETLFVAQGEPDVEETYDELSTDEASSNYYVSKINDSSHLVDVTRIGSTRPDNGIAFLQLPEVDSNDDGDDDGVGFGDYLGDEMAPRGERTGLAGFEERDDISIVCIPDENRVPNLAGVAADHCEQMEDRFAVMQAEQGADPGSLPPQSTISDFGAIYYPHVEVVDPETNERKTVPPGGHVAGIYARTDANRGVHKAPANEVVRGAVGLEIPVTRADQERLNPRGVNAIRSFQGRGIRVWGARTTSPNPLWKYVNVRRLMLFIEESIENGTQWAVFEPNDEQLWARLRQSVRNFLTTVWRSGGLMGSTEDEAFYVKCDRTTMTQDDIDNGRLIVEVGVAPTKPAEFVVFRITQWTEGVEGGS